MRCAPGLEPAKTSIPGGERVNANTGSMRKLGLHIATHAARGAAAAAARRASMLVSADHAVVEHQDNLGRVFRHPVAVGPNNTPPLQLPAARSVPDPVPARARARAGPCVVDATPAA